MSRSGLLPALARATTSLGALAGILGALASASPASATDTLIERSVTHFARLEALSAYDTRRHRVVQLGGRREGWIDDSAVFLFDPAAGKGWSVPAVLGTPPTQFTGSAVYDSLRDRVLVFADEGAGVWSLSCGTPMTWQALAPTGTRPVLTRGGAIHDRARDRVVGFGGETGAPANTVNATWSLSLGATPAWSTLATAGGAPPARGRFACLNDPGHDRMIVFGGETVVADAVTQRNDVMTLSFGGGIATWNTLPAVGPPAVRTGPAVVLDPARNRLVVFAGAQASNFQTETWVLPLGDPTPTWQALPPASFANGRFGMIAAYDPFGDRMVVAGGSVGPPYVVNDAWQLPLAAPGPAWTFLPARGAVPSGGSITGYDPVRQRFVAKVTGTNGVAPWFLSRADSTWTPTLPAGTPPTGVTILQAFYDWRRGTFYAVSADTLYSYDPDNDPTWARTPTSGPTPIQPTRIGPWFYDDDAQRFLMIGGEALATDFRLASPQFAALDFTPTPHWTIVTENNPMGVREAPAILDRRRHRLLVFGGGQYAGRLSPPSAANDLWQVDLATLAITALAPAGTPPSPRYLYAAAYDSLRDRLLVFGGGSFGTPEPGAYYLQFGPADAQGTWSRNDPVGAPLPDFFAGGISDHIADWDAADDRYVVAGDPVMREILPGPAAPALSVTCPPRAAWTPGAILPLTFRITQGVSGAHEYAWRVDGARAWPGFPLLGTQAVGAAGGVDVGVGIPVPDSAAAGLDSLRFTVHDLADPSRRDSCGTAIGDAGSPVLWALADVIADAGGVTLTWWIADRTQAQARIERSDDGAAWARAGEAAIGGDGRVVFADPAVEPGRRYGYRAGIPSGDAGGWAWSDEAWVDVPAAAPLALAFVARGTLLARGALDVAFTAPRAGAARLEAFDVAGRLVAARTVEVAAAGRVTARLGGAGAMRPGMYFLRLTQGEESVRSRALVLGAP